MYIYPYICNLDIEDGEVFLSVPLRLCITCTDINNKKVNGNDNINDNDIIDSDNDSKTYLKNSRSDDDNNKINNSDNDDSDDNDNIDKKKIKKFNLNNDNLENNSYRDQYYKDNGILEEDFSIFPNRENKPDINFEGNNLMYSYMCILIKYRTFYLYVSVHTFIQISKHLN
jgi:hypothetical protein